MDKEKKGGKKSQSSTNRNIISQAQYPQLDELELESF